MIFAQQELQTGAAEGAGKLSVQRILVPVDADLAQPGDLRSILKLAHRFGAQVILLHCYSPPFSFDYAIGRSAIADVILNHDRARARLHELCADVRKFFIHCHCAFVHGCLFPQVVTASERLHSNLIAIPISLGPARRHWISRDLFKKITRKANCPVLVSTG